MKQSMGFRFLIILSVLICFGVLQQITIADQNLTLKVINDSDSLNLKVIGDSQKSQRIEFKSDYSPWALLTSDTGKSEWNFPISSSDQRRLFRVVESVRPRNFNHSSWKGNLDFPEEPFLSENLGESFEVVRWVKFTILMDDSNKVGSFLNNQEEEKKSSEPYNENTEEQQKMSASFY